MASVTSSFFVTSSKVSPVHSGAVGTTGQRMAAYKGTFDNNKKIPGILFKVLKLTDALVQLLHRPERVPLTGRADLLVHIPVRLVPEHGVEAAVVPTQRPSMNERFTS